MEKKLERLKEILTGLGSVVIAYSGGVDSTFLLAVAHHALGGHVLAVTATSPTYPSGEKEAAQALAKGLGVRHLIIETAELADPSFVANDRHRCYYCKRELFTRLRQIASDEGLSWVTDGSNYDDRGDYRPGSTAAAELGVCSPLCEAELTKADIRALSRRWGLATWDKPSLACLASRLPYGTPITLEVLKRISQAEDYLHQLGLSQVRVRHHDNIARIELDPESMRRLMDEGMRLSVVKHLRALGYSYVTLDLAGYRTGSLNEVLNQEE